MDLSTNYLGLKLRSPLVASASPLSETLDGVRALDEAGIGAIVLYSLFEEQLTLSPIEITELLATSENYSDGLERLSESNRLRQSPLAYLQHVYSARQATKVPIIASINGSPNLRYAHYAKLLQQAGASAIELNLYYVTTDPRHTGADVERAYLDTVAEVLEEVEIPVAIKMSPYFSNVSNMAKRIEEVGASALVLFNRFYQPDIDIDRRVLRTRLDLSTSVDLRLPLRWTAILRDQIDIDLALTGGVHSPDDVIKSILAGANAVMVCSALLRNGLDQIQALHRGLSAWMAAEEVNHLDEVRGTMSHGQVADPSAFERAQYIRTLEGGDWG